MIFSLKNWMLFSKEQFFFNLIGVVRESCGVRIELDQAFLMRMGKLGRTYGRLFMLTSHYKKYNVFWADYINIDIQKYWAVRRRAKNTKKYGYCSWC